MVNNTVPRRRDSQVLVPGMEHSNIWSRGPSSTKAMDSHYCSWSFTITSDLLAEDTVSFGYRTCGSRSQNGQKLTLSLWLAFLVLESDREAEGEGRKMSAV